jgi:LysR family hca operon transcriptional activator
VAEELNFTRAAERLHTAQPSLSQQIRTLEDYLGLKLLTRSNRKVELTSAGERFLGEARLALAQAEKAIIRARQTGGIDHLKLGFTPGLIVELLPRLRPFIDASFPNAQVSARSMTAQDLEQGLKEEEFDMIFTNILSQDYGVISHRLSAEPLVIAYPTSDELGVTDNGETLAPLKGRLIITDAMSMPLPVIRQFEKECAERGAAVAGIYEAGNFLEALGLILSGGGVGLFDSSFSRLTSVGLTTRRLGEAGPKIDVVAAHTSAIDLGKLNELLKISQEINVVHN